MNTKLPRRILDRSSALFLGFYKFPDAVLTDRFKIFEHTPAIIFAVTLVELPETFTRKLCTIVMVLPQYLVTAKYSAVFMALPVRSITSTAPVLFP